MKKLLIQWIGETREDRICLAQGYSVCVSISGLYFIALNMGLRL